MNVHLFLKGLVNINNNVYDIDIGEWREIFFFFKMVKIGNAAKIDVFEDWPGS